MLIRELQPGDTGQARAIWNSVVMAGNAFPQEEQIASDDEARCFFQSQTRCAVAVDDAAGSDEVLGLYILHPNNEGRCSHVANASYAVAASARGRGIGRALVEDSLASLGPCGFAGLQFNAVVASNASALNLYEKLDFTRVGTIPGGFRNKNDVVEDIHIFYHAAPSPA